jgi:hypothetical protein
MTAKPSTQPLCAMRWARHHYLHHRMGTTAAGNTAKHRCRSEMQRLKRRLKLKATKIKLFRWLNIVCNLSYFEWQLQWLDWRTMSDSCWHSETDNYMHSTRAFVLDDAAPKCA